MRCKSIQRETHSGPSLVEREELVVVEVRVDEEVIFKRLDFLCRTPSFSEHSTHMRADHRRRVVETKQRIKAPALELTKSHRTRSATFKALVLNAR